MILENIEMIKELLDGHASNPVNINSDGSINWDFVDCDVRDSVRDTDAGWDLDDHKTEKEYYEIFDSYALTLNKGPYL